MSRSTNYAFLAMRTSSFLKAFATYVIEDNDAAEFISKEEPTLYSVDFTIGNDQFTLNWFYDLMNIRVYFKTYFWQFDPNVDSDFKKVLIENLYIISSDEELWLSNSVNRHYAYDISYRITASSLKSLISNYISNLNNKITEYYRPEIDKIEGREINSKPNFLTVG